MGSVKYLLSPHPPPTPTPSFSSTSYKSFPILVISILGILTTAIILVGYYVFVVRCSINRRRRPSLSTNQALPTTTKSRGLEESAIRAIPTLRFKRNDDEKYGNGNTRSFPHDCSVCLGEFEEEEKLRVLPNCSHVFHIDCIDTWLQTSPNCPTCRSDISNLKDPNFPLPLLTHTQQSSVIDVRDEPGGSPTTTEQQNLSAEKVREREEQLFSYFQPIRRSFSVDSSSDRKLYFAVQEILRQNQHQSSRFKEEEGNRNSNGNVGRIKRSFFSFGHSRSSRSASSPSSSCQVQSMIERDSSSVFASNLFP